MPDIQTVAPHLIHIGAILYLVCFLFRNQVMLRSFAVAGDCAYLAYYYGAASTPLWGAIGWTIPNMMINVVMIILILRDRRVGTFNEDELALFQNLRGLNPGQFRRLMKTGRWQKAGAETVLTREGEELNELHYVLAGDVEVDKAGRRIPVAPAVFIGELAYLRKKPATATVRVKPGAVYVSWKHADLAKITQKDDGLSSALGTLLSNDLAEKVARS